MSELCKSRLGLFSSSAAGSPKTGQLLSSASSHGLPLPPLPSSLRAQLCSAHLLPGSPCHLLSVSLTAHMALCACACLCSIPAVLEVVPRQAQWRYSCLPDPAISLYSDLAECLGPAHLIQLLQKAMSVEEVCTFPRVGVLAYARRIGCPSLTAELGSHAAGGILLPPLQ